MVKTQPFNTAQHLDNPEVIAWYLADAFETRDSAVILNAIQAVLRAGNMSKIARATGMSRTSLYWGKDTSPEFTTVLKVLAARGVRLRAEPDLPAVSPSVLMSRKGEGGRRTAKKAQAVARKKK
jgi:probable addiction module antidote protein